MKYSEREKEHLKTIYRHLAECTVLLKHDHAFPLKEAGEIALYGSGARHTLRGGTGSGEVYSRHAISIEEGLSRTGFTVTTKDWLDSCDEILKSAKAQFILDIQKRAKEKHVQAVIEGMGAVMPQPEYSLPLNGAGDTAVYVLSRISGEGNDREAVKGDILLTDTEVRDILALKDSYKKFMLVLNVGGPVDLTPVLDVENILLLSQLGDAGGRILGDILLGKKNPSGKLTTTWTAWEDQPSILDFGDRNHTRYREGIYVGYRYYDTMGVQPLFPFGYGQSYTMFKIGETNASLDGKTVSVSALVKNIGDFAGKETLQLYISKPRGKLDQPAKELAGWAKTKELLPGHEERVEISFDLSMMASFDLKNSTYLLEQGDYLLQIGNSSRDTAACGIVRLEETVTLRKVRSSLGTIDFTDFVPHADADSGKTEDGAAVKKGRKKLPVLCPHKDAFTFEEVDYDVKETIDPRTEGLTDEELIYLGIGAFDPKGGALSIIGNASMSVAGAAGETTHQVDGISSLVMADGPAGLRLSQKYWKDKKGVTHAIGNPLLESLTEFMPKYQQVFMKRMMVQKPKKYVEVREQYATALPIGTAIAQSWNLDFAKLCGDIAGTEMQEFGVHLWLAPALNIHRSIRCGRNFEYYSEDPVVSGYFAAAITEGVQQHPGCGVTIKHFAANNQEQNRYFSNSIVSERAMREIYLKGFELCIRKSHPESLMTSYNLLNGTHTSERRDLTTDILRREFGFEGLVMTDWLVSGMMDKNSENPPASAEKIAAAGGELVMPGGKGDFRKMQEGLKNGALSRRQLQINASRLLASIDRLTEGK